MSIETIYFKTEKFEQFQNQISQNAFYYGDTVAQDRRTFLTTLAEAVSRSEVIITVGQLTLITSVLARGLGAELSPVDFKGLGINATEEVLLPQGSLPLVLENEVVGMLLENSGQCIIAVDSDEQKAIELYDMYIKPYIEALQISMAQENNQEPQEDEKALEQKDDLNQEAVPLEQDKGVETSANVDKIDVKAPITMPASIHKIMQENKVDIFADMELSEEEIDRIVPPRSFKWLRNLIIFVVIVALIVGGGMYAFTNYLAPEQYNKAYQQTKKAYNQNKADKEVFATGHFNYSLDFTDLYKINNDVIAYLKMPSLDVEFPVATTENKTTDYYKEHSFNKQFSLYGAAYVEGMFNKSNMPVNLVIKGTSRDEQRMFGFLPKYLDKQYALDNHTFVLQTVFDEEPIEWQVFAVIKTEKSQSEFANNFSTLSAPERQQVIKNALEQSVVNFGVDTVSYLNDMGTYRYVTLTTEHDGQNILVMARNVIKTQNAEITSKPANQEESQKTQSEQTQSEPQEIESQEAESQQ